MAKRHSIYLEKLAAYLRDELHCPDARALDAKEYFRIVGYGKGSLGGIVCENSLPIVHGETIADASDGYLPIAPPIDTYFEPSTSWAIALYTR